jgi:hypothetical protein
MGRVVNTADYTFNKTAKTITFSSRYTGIELAQIQLITDVTNSTVIYQFNKAGFGGTLVGLVLTLAYDTTGAGFNNTDNLMIIVNETQDNTVLYSGTLTNTGSISGFDTTDFQTVSIQVSGSWEGIVMVEGSNDNSYYVPLMTYPINEFTLVDNINEDGIYNLTTPTKFVRLNVVQLVTGSINTLIHGRTVDGPNAADVLSMAMDRTQRMPLITEDIAPLKKDATNALILSDNAGPYYYSGPSFSTIPQVQLDATGYYSIVIQATLVNTSIRIQGSQNGISWNDMYLYNMNVGGGSLTSVVGGQGVFIAPIATKFIRLIPNADSAGFNTFTAYLKQQPPSYLGLSGMGVTVNGTPTINLTSIGSNSVGQCIGLSAGGGTIQQPLGGLAVGATAAHGSTNVAYPIMIGGRQAPTAAALGGFVRQMLMDSDGRVQMGLNILDQTRATNAQLTGSQLQVITNNFQNGNSLAVTDLSQFEGQNQTELLGQILLEMRIMNQYLYELPQKLNAGQNNLDEPTQFRNETSAFTL